MAKSPSPKRRQNTNSTREHREPRENQDMREQDVPEEQAAVAVVAAPPPPRAERSEEEVLPPKEADDQPHQGNTGGDLGAIDEETNQKYEQVKGGKLYIRDLQRMDVHQLHEIAKQDQIVDY